MILPSESRAALSASEPRSATSTVTLLNVVVFTVRLIVLLLDLRIILFGSRIVLVQLSDVGLIDTLLLKTITS